MKQELQTVDLDSLDGVSGGNIFTFGAAKFGASVGSAVATGSF